MGILKELTVSVSAGICLSDDEGKLIMVRQRKSELWGIPAGGMKALESPVAAMYRELEEETGIPRRRVENLELLGVYSIIRNQEKTSMGHIFRGRIKGRYELEPRDDEIDKADKFGKTFIETFISKPQWLYKPEFNRQALIDFINGRRNRIY